MATIVRRIEKDSQPSYRTQVRRKGAPPLSATFTRLSEARKWVQVAEAAIVEGRHFKTAAAKRHTLSDLLDGLQGCDGGVVKIPVRAACRVRTGSKHAVYGALPFAFPRCSRSHKQASLVAPSSLKK
jgi:hypothetical protein